MALIANLVARLRAETSSFERGMSKSRRSLYGMTSEIQRTQQSLLSFGRAALGLVGVTGGLYALKRGLTTIVNAAMEQEKAERELVAALDLTGKAAKSTLAEFKDYASQIQRVTVYGDEEILTQMAYAKNLGVTRDQLKEATKAAIGLAARYKIDLQSAMMLVGRASQGQTQMLTRYGIVINQSLSDQEKFNEILRIGGESFRLAEEAARTAEGAIQQRKNAISDLAETIGGPLKDAWVGFSIVIKENAVLLDDWLKKLQQIRQTPGIPTEKDLIEKGLLPFAPTPAEREAFDKLTEELGRLREEEAKTGWQGSYGVIPTGKGRAMAEMDKWREMAKPVAISAVPSHEAMYGIAAGYQSVLRYREEEKKLAKELEEAAEKTKRQWESVGTVMQFSMTSALDRALWETRDWGDATIAIIRDVMREAMRMQVIQPLVSGGMKLGSQLLAAIPAIFAERGGTVGQDIFPTRLTPAMAFAGGPEFEHGGAVPALVHPGEQIIPKGGGNITVNINNQTGIPVKVSDVRRMQSGFEQQIFATLRRAYDEGRQGWLFGR